MALAELGFGEWLVLGGGALALLFLLLHWAVGVALIAVLLACFFWRRWKHFKFFKKLGIRGPAPSLLMGNIPDYQRDGIWQCDLKWAKEYGKIYGVFSGSQPELMVLEPDILRQFLVKDFANFTDRGRGSSSVTKSKTMFAQLLTVLKGERWKEVRATVTPVFDHEKIRLMAPLIQERARILADVLGGLASQKKPFHLKRVWGGFTMDVLASVVFGVEANAQRDDASPFLEHANEAIDIISLDNWKIIVQILFSYCLLKLNHWTGWQLLFREGEAFFTAVVEQIKRERGANPGRTPLHHSITPQGRSDFIGLLLKEMEEAKYENTLDAVSQHPEFAGIAKLKLNVQETAAQCFIFLAAGYDTTSIALQFLSYNLALHPEVQERLHDEIVDVLGPKREASFEDLGQMPYLDAVIKESLRMYPPGLRCERRAKDNCTLGGFEIPAGTSVVCPILAIHHNPEFWPEPEAFKPERFLETKHRDPLTFIPFGYGPRNCVGQRFALTEIKVALAHLLPRFRLRLRDDTPLPPLCFAKFGFLKPDVTLELNAEHR